MCAEVPDEEKEAAGPREGVPEWLGVEMKMKSCGRELRGDVCHMGLDVTGESMLAPTPAAWPSTPLLWLWPFSLPLAWPLVWR